MKVQTHIRTGNAADGIASGVSESLLTDPISAAVADLQSILTSDRVVELYDILKRESTPWFRQYSFITNSPTGQDTCTETSRSFTKFDEMAQTFAQRWVDPVFGQARARQIEALGEEMAPPEVSDVEKEVNRRILISLGSLGLALSGSWWFSPLLIGAVAGAVYTTLPIYLEAYRSVVKRHQVNLSVVAGLNLLGTWAGGFFTAGTLGIVVYLLGQKLVSKTEDNSRQRLVDVFGKQPRTAWQLRDDGTEVEVPFDQIRAGDILAVQAGQVVPADGVITQGTATIDQHTLTGEAQPVEKGVGETVFATTVVLTGAIRLRVEKAGRETTAAQIADILNRTSSYQMALESKALQFANRSALPSLIVSGIAWPVAGYQGAVAILGANLGSNIKLTAPISMLNFLNVTLRNGVLIKDGRSLELLNEIDTIVFDKTGTLTLEDLQLAQVHSFNGFSEKELLTMACTAEQRQSHPIARAIKQAAQARGLSSVPIDDAHYQVGFGIRVLVGDRMIRVGSARFMEMEKIELSTEMRALQRIGAAQGYSLVWVAVGKQVSGALELHATVRPEAKQVIERLHQRKLRLYILSGDQQEPTCKLAKELGIDDYFANTLPEGKAAVIEQLQKEGRSVCFVGDGINDAIALKKANVSISLQGATTIAIDTAQIVLLDQNLNQLTNLLDTAHEFDMTLRRGIAAALIPDALLMGGVFLAGFGIYASIVLYSIGLTAGLGNAMVPLLKYRNANTLSNRGD